MELTVIKTSTKQQITNNIIRYAWGNSSLKTWFITKTKHRFLPKGCKLLFVINGEHTNATISIVDTYPTVGDVISDIDGNKLLVKNVEWI